eukprot:TRINITY_DN21936_c0_g1_i3.p1 TRINITY_DN21936_c0_g1~~TRINITY_DN21936_c0_g1_i3.p1  ORF type:complete len:143 (+),score=42.37 TRINITY_DN21936_c0_g1_i3:79-507(+)
MADALFQKMGEALATPQGQAAAKKVSEVITYEFGDTGNKFVMDLKQGKVYKGEAFEAAKQGKFVQVRAHLGLPAMMRSLLESCWLPTGQRSSAGSFAADCKPREMSKALPEDSSAYESFKSVMYARDNDFGAWLEKHEKVRT